jgi:hypothetical protein
MLFLQDNDWYFEYTVLKLRKIKGSIHFIISEKFLSL